MTPGICVHHADKGHKIAVKLYCRVFLPGRPRGHVRPSTRLLVDKHLLRAARRCVQRSAPSIWHTQQCVVEKTTTLSCSVALSLYFLHCRGEELFSCGSLSLSFSRSLSLSCVCVFFSSPLRRGIASPNLAHKVPLSLALAVQRRGFSAVAWLSPASIACARREGKSRHTTLFLKTRHYSCTTYRQTPAGVGALIESPTECPRAIRRPDRHTKE